MNTHKITSEKQSKPLFLHRVSGSASDNEILHRCSNCKLTNILENSKDIDTAKCKRCNHSLSDDIV